MAERTRNTDQYVRTKSGKTFHLFNNREVAKFLLFVAPRLHAAGDELEGKAPRIVMTDEVNALAKIAQKIRKNREVSKKMPPFPAFNDDIPF